MPSLTRNCRRTIQQMILNRLIAEFNRQQISPSADVIQNALTLKFDALLLLATVLHNNLDMEILYFTNQLPI